MKYVCSRASMFVVRFTTCSREQTDVRCSPRAHGNKLMLTCDHVLPGRRPFYYTQGLRTLVRRKKISTKGPCCRILSAGGAPASGERRRKNRRISKSCEDRLNCRITSTSVPFPFTVRRCLSRCEERVSTTHCDSAVTDCEDNVTVCSRHSFFPP